MELKEIWQKCFSKTHKREYWFNSSNDSTSWTNPFECAENKLDDVDNEKTGNNHLIRDDNLSDGTAVRKRLKLNDDKNFSEVNKEKILQTQNPQIRNAKIAIIVPFRDLHVEQNRKAHLQEFVPKITNFLSLAHLNFKIFIIEQSNDGRKFNRGKLLNIGFDIAVKNRCEIFIFHDVDLLPSPELLDFYTRLPSSNPIHIARVWPRYSTNHKYFGGIVSFNEEQFVRINGFPNNFWGWGGEDDELYNRTREVGFVPTFPTSGTITDLEDMTLIKKLEHLRANPLWKCMNKQEVLKEHGDKAQWKSNGYHQLIS